MPRKKRSTFGSVTKLGPDRWRLRWWADGPDGHKRRTEIVRGTRRQVDDRLAEIRLGTGSKPGGCPTVGYAYEAWYAPGLADRLSAGEVADRYVRNVSCVWSRHVAPRWKDVPVDQVRPMDVQEWLLGKRGQPAAMCKSVLRQVLDICERFELIDGNPLSKRYRTGSGEQTADRGIYALDQLLAVARAARGSFIEGAVLLAAFGSCRVGESLGVMCSEVEAAESDGVEVACAPVVRQVDNATGKVVERLKNSQSRRWVVVPGPVGSRLLEVAREGSGRGDAWLCDRGDGRPISQGVLGKEWRSVVEKAGVEHHPFRNLRSSWLTFMRWELMVDPAMLEPMMGHAGKGVTAAHYDRSGKAQFVARVAAAYKERPFAIDWDI